MALTHSSSLPRTRSGRTFFVALTLLGVGALTQLLVLAGYLIGGRAASSHQSVATPVPTVPTAAGSPRPAVAAVTPVLPSPAVPSGTVAPPVAAADTPAPFIRPTPALVLRAQNSFTDLLEQARQLRARGDMNSALARLREAQVAEPDNAQIIAEMAMTYETMQLPDRAFEQWQRLSNLGESVGALYALAKMKLQSVPSTPAPATAGGTINPQDGSFQSSGDAILKLMDVHKEDLADPAAEQKVSLRIVVKNRPGTAIDPTKVRILTYFYDLVDGKDVVLTDAQTSFAWLTPGKIDWANDKSEVLETVYTRPKAAPTPTPAPPAAAPVKKTTKKVKGGTAETTVTVAATPTPTPGAAPVRTYLGYTVRLYYDRQLQDVQADPVRLLQQFPPVMTLPAE